jgi:hypothetical protein
MGMRPLGHDGSRKRPGFMTLIQSPLNTMRNKPFDYVAKVERAPPQSDAEAKMSTTSHKSHNRIQNEVAMKTRIHTARKVRDLTLDGLDKHHHEARTLKVLAKSARVRIATKAA